MGEDDLVIQWHNENGLIFWNIEGEGKKYDDFCKWFEKHISTPVINDGEYFSLTKEEGEKMLKVWSDYIIADERGYYNEANTD